jgi:ATP-dependent Lhr-like helicase
MLRRAAGHPDHDAGVALPAAHLAGARDARRRRTLILDEVHAVAGTKRGAHLALSVERLDRLSRARPARRPLGDAAAARGDRPLRVGRAPIELVDAGTRKELDLEVVVPVEDMREPGAASQTDPLLGRARGVAATSIWPSIYPELLELVEEHRSTIVFVNNRRLAERLALRLNELAEEELARAHHGSLAREQRVEVEELLKRGEIPCLVATSSLELGIDMGAVDLVIQVESPKSVARGLQRIGRAGHELGAVSKGRIFPKFRADLLESAVVAERMRAGEIEETAIPRNPLDVLAQQIVAICAEEEIEVGELHELVRGAYPFADLSRAQLENVLDMLAGRYPSDEFAELRPRIVWDRTGGTIRGRDGARGSRSRTRARSPTAASSACTSSTAAAGSASSTRRWSTRRARARRSCSAPRPGGSRRSRATACSSRRRRACRARCRSGRARASGGRTSSASRSARPRASCRASRAKALERLRERALLDERAAQNLLTFLREQQRDGRVPSDRTIVVERFRDEIGDWRVCILTPFGARVHAPWAMAVGARLRDSLGLEAQSIWSDDGIALPPARRRRAAADRGLIPTRTSSRTSSCRRSGRPRSSARASARTPAARC